ncbi:hypothetical protein PQX77_005276, partial [Marasmius sp. AFHP31]
GIAPTLIILRARLGMSYKPVVENVSGSHSRIVFLVWELIAAFKPQPTKKHKCHLGATDALSTSTGC